MTLRLSIENMDRMPDGGPLRVEARSRGLDIGRDAHLDWTLPDPSRYVSSKHCEIRFRDGGYWLHDVSTNGTFVNDAHFRLSEPYLLKDGDRLSIGHYLVAVEVKGDALAHPRDVAPPPPAGSNPWSEVGEAAAPEDRRAFKTPQAASRAPDFLDYVASVRPEDPMASAFAPPTVDPDAWIVQPAPTPSAVTPIVEPVIAPTPRRPVERAPPPPGQQPGLAIAATSADVADVLRRLADAAGIPKRALVDRDPDAVIGEIGVALRLSVENLAQMLSVRAESKSLMRSSSRTMIRARENNPLKFAATPEDALAIMFGPPSSSYLNARATIAESFADIKNHQVLTGLATQAAIEELFEELAPPNLEKSVEPERGLGAFVGSRKAKLWDVFVERWRLRTKRTDGRLSEAFAALFADAYDRLLNRNR